MKPFNRRVELGTSRPEPSIGVSIDGGSVCRYELQPLLLLRSFWAGAPAKLTASGDVAAVVREERLDVGVGLRILTVLVLPVEAARQCTQATNDPVHASAVKMQTRPSGRPQKRTTHMQAVRMKEHEPARFTGRERGERQRQVLVQADRQATTACAKIIG